VVTSVRVDRHFRTVKPSIIAGKTVYVEWPLEKNLEIAKEMASLAASHNSKTIVGLQGSFAPIVQKMKQTIESGAIGKILSSTLVAALSNGGAAESKNIRYFLQREVGGNLMTIHTPHTLEFITTGSLSAS
jgi:predicted dehydrogenase